MHQMETEQPASINWAAVDHDQRKEGSRSAPPKLSDGRGDSFSEGVPGAVDLFFNSPEMEAGGPNAVRYFNDCRAEDGYEEFYRNHPDKMNLPRPLEVPASIQDILATISNSPLQTPTQQTNRHPKQFAMKEGGQGALSPNSGFDGNVPLRVPTFVPQNPNNRLGAGQQMYGGEPYFQAPRQQQQQQQQQQHAPKPQSKAMKGRKGQAKPPAPQDVLNSDTMDQLVNRFNNNELNKVKYQQTYLEQQLSALRTRDDRHEENYSNRSIPPKPMHSNNPPMPIPHMNHPSDFNGWPNDGSSHSGHYPDYPYHPAAPKPMMSDPYMSFDQSQGYGQYMDDGMQAIPPPPAAAGWSASPYQEDPYYEPHHQIGTPAYGNYEDQYFNQPAPTKPTQQVHQQAPSWNAPPPAISANTTQTLPKQSQTKDTKAPKVPPKKHPLHEHFMMVEPTQSDGPLTTLDDVLGNIYLTAKDQYGCRFLQKLIGDGNPSDLEKILGEVYEHSVELMTDPFGNYLMQKLLEHCNDSQRYMLVQKVAPHLVSIALNMHGTRAVQTLVETLSTSQQCRLVMQALEKSVVTLIKDLNGNHVIQRCLQKLSFEDKHFIYEAVAPRCVEVATHRHGCCVLQRCIDHASDEQKMMIIDEVAKNALRLVTDSFGNYVVQYVLDLGIDHISKRILCTFVGGFAALATNKFSSNVMEKVISIAQDNMRETFMLELIDPERLPQLLQDQYANYVIQTALSVANPNQFRFLSEAIRPNVTLVKNTPYGKKIESKINRGVQSSIQMPRRGGGRTGATPPASMPNTQPMNVARVPNVPQMSPSPIAYQNAYNSQAGYQPPPPAVMSSPHMPMQNPIYPVPPAPMATPPSGNLLAPNSLDMYAMHGDDGSSYEAWQSQNQYWN